MTDIEKKAYEKYPSVLGFPIDEQVDLNEEARNAYIKSCEEYESLPKIHGWIAKDDSLYNPSLCVHLEKPVKDLAFHYWDSKGKCVCIDKKLFPEITWESEPVEVELLIRKI